MILTVKDLLLICMFLFPVMSMRDSICTITECVYHFQTDLRFFLYRSIQYLELRNWNLGIDFVVQMRVNWNLGIDFVVQMRVISHVSAITIF